MKKRPKPIKAWDDKEVKIKPPKYEREKLNWVNLIDDDQLIDGQTQKTTKNK